LALDLDMQIWDRGAEGLNELARRAEAAPPRLRRSIVIPVVGREQLIDHRKVAPIPSSIVELLDGRLQVLAHHVPPSMESHASRRLSRSARTTTWFAQCRVPTPLQIALWRGEQLRIYPDRQLGIVVMGNR
jgi:hypothetical protein